MEDVRREVLRWALANASEHGGSASAKAVMGKVIAELPGWKSNVATLSKLVEEVVAEVNSMPAVEQLFQIKKVGAVEQHKQEQRKGLQELPEVERFSRVVTRFAPNPNGPLHLGHARAAVLSHDYARKYNGKFILRFEDTNPENVMLEMYELIKMDLRWLGLSWDEEHIQSDRMQLYYDYAEQLLGEGKAYVCTCEPGGFGKLRDAGEACPCREIPADENLVRWEKMMSGDFKEGEAVVRIKTDLAHPNPAVRDWPALRIVDDDHARVGKKYKVWPLYNFSVSIDDHEMGVTHVLRGKEHEVNEERQRKLYGHLGWEYPVAVQYGRFSIPGSPLSKTQTMKAIKAGELVGHDDVRLATIAALRRRGFLPEALRQLVTEIGLTQVDSVLSWETIFSHNRKLADGVASRYFFVPDPVKLLVAGSPEIKEARLRTHPSRPDAGERILPLKRDGKVLVFHIPASDVAGLRVGDIFRLKDLMNVKLAFKDGALEADFVSLTVADVPKFQWASAGAVGVEVTHPDGRVEPGLAEPAVTDVQPGTLVQFERYGFARIESVGPKVKAIYAHR
ncbi:MAG: glutamate--tRNA ligase [Candidatus Hadarchaeota archaeon]